MVVDSHGAYHIAFSTSAAKFTERYATNVSGTWNSTVVDNVGFVGLWSSLKIDKNDALHLTYHSNGKVAYAYLAQGVWMKTILQDPDTCGIPNALSLDAYGNAHITYYSNTISGLKYAVQKSVPSEPTLANPDRGNAAVNLTWSLPVTDGGAALTGYAIYRGPSADNLTKVATIAAGELAYQDGALTNGQRYYYAVAAINTEGVGPKSNVLSAVPATIPGTPQNLQVTASNGQVVLSWSAPSADGGATVLHYSIYRSNTTANGTLIGTVDAPATSYTDTNVENGKTYYYWVSATNEIGSGALAGSVTGEPKADDLTLIILVIVVVIAIVAVAGYVVLSRRGAKGAKPKKK
jgi:hypothetical protein